MAIIRGNLFTTQLLVNYGADTTTLSKVEEIHFSFKEYFIIVVFFKAGGKTLQQLATSTNKMVS